MNEDIPKSLTMSVVWSEEDKSWVGTCSDMMDGGVHGDDPVLVWMDLFRAVANWIEVQSMKGLDHA